MFAPSERESLRTGLIERARADERIAAGALTGSAALGTADQWSGIDLASGVADGASRPAGRPAPRTGQPGLTLPARTRPLPSSANPPPPAHACPLQRALARPS